MIRFYRDSDSEEIVLLWQDAFGDGRKSVEDFLNRFGENVLVYEFDEKPVSMLTALPVEIDGKKGRYVYAVATAKEYRKRGFSSRLIDYLKEYILLKGESFLVLLPANGGLFGFYEKIGFTELCCAQDIVTSYENANDCEVEIIGAAEYLRLRDRFFGGKGYVKWDEEMLSYMKNIYGGYFVRIKRDEKIIGCSFCYLKKDSVIAQELLGEDNALPKAICEYFGKSEISGVKACVNGSRYAMIYPKEYGGVYFGLGMN